MSEADNEPTTDAKTERGVQYKGAPLDSAKGPGLGCFWTQVVLLVIAIVLTPLSAAWGWPVIVSIVLLAATLVLLLFVGQTSIFLMRLVAADRRAEGRRRPLRSATPTVGQIEDAAGGPARVDEPADDGTEGAHGHRAGPDGPGGGGVRE